MHTLCTHVGVGRALRRSVLDVKFVLACLAVLAAGAVVAFLPAWVLLVALVAGTAVYVANDRRRRS